MKSKVIPFDRLYKKPISYKLRKYAHKEGFYICIRDGAFIGIGEISPLPEYSNESIDEIKHVLKSIVPLLNELKSPDSLQDIRTIIDMISSIPNSVQFGLEMALLVMLAHKKKLPLSNLLNSDCSYTVKLNTLITPNALDSVSNAVRRGFECFKLKVGRQSFEEDMRFTMDVLSRLSEKQQLKIDCNGLWTLTNALEFSKRIDHSRVKYIEDPFPNIEDQRRFVSASNIPLALDEYYHSFDFIEYKHISYLVVKPMIRGSILSLLSLPKKIKEKIVISSSFETEIGLLGLLHVSSAFGLNRYHGLDTLHFFKDDSSFEITGSMDVLELPSFTSLIKKEWIPV